MVQSKWQLPCILLRSIWFCNMSLKYINKKDEVETRGRSRRLNMADRCLCFCHDKDKEKAALGKVQASRSLRLCTRLCSLGKVEGYSEQLGSGYKWGRCISKGGKGCHLRVSMIDVDRAACSSAHAKPSPTVTAATDRKRKWADLGGHSDKMLNNSSEALWVVGQGHMCKHKEHGERGGCVAASAMYHSNGGKLPHCIDFRHGMVEGHVFLWETMKHLWKCTWCELDLNILI